MDRIKETKLLNARAARAWDVFIELYPRLVKFDCPIIVLNGRFTKTAGMAYTTLNKIDISLKFYLFHRNHILNNTLIHEIAHQVDSNLYGEENTKALQGHGPTWCKIMNDYGLPADRYHSLSIPDLKLSEMLEAYNAK